VPNNNTGQEGNIVDFDLENMSLDDLKKLEKDVARAIRSYSTRKLLEARQKLEAQAREMGYSLNEIIDVPAKGKSVNPPKYRHPENPDLTWSGRGRKPRWITEAIDRGIDIETFRI